MKDENGIRTATTKQVAFIQMLKRNLGEKNPVLNEDLSVDEASSLISDLIIKAGHQGSGCRRKKGIKTNEPRLGMATKECFRIWRKYGKDLYGSKSNVFKDEVIRTYCLFTEIAEEVEQGQSPTVLER